MLATVGKNVKTILSAIRNKAHYGGQIAIVNYYSLDYSSRRRTRRPRCSTPPSTTRPSRSTSWSRMASASSRPRRRIPGGNSCTAGLLTQLSTGGCGIHPSYAGQSLLAQALEKAIQSLS